MKLLVILLWFTVHPASKSLDRPERVIKTPEIIEVTATVYHNVPSQCNNDPFKTACGISLSKRPYNQRILAVSRDLEKDFPMGSEVLILGVGSYSGYWTVGDRMNKRWTYKIDLLINQDMKIGKWEAKIIKKNHVL